MSSAISLTKRERRQVDAAAEILRPWGLAWSLTRTEHLVMLVQGPRALPGQWRLTIACTPRDADRAVMHARNNAKSIVRDINKRLGL